MRETPALSELLQKYAEGRCSPEEAEQLALWLEQLQHETEAPSPLTGTDEERLVQRLRMHPRFAATAEPASKRWSLFRLSWQAAAVWIGLAMLGAYWLLLSQVQPGKPANQPKSSQPVWVTITTRQKQQKKISLPDGSQVWLNAGSSLCYNRDFLHCRELQLQGEAFFDVVHDAAHPFTVHAGNAVTRVYGTRFNIEAYAAAAEVRVALQRGKIGIASGASAGEEVLQPGQLFIYHKQTHTREIKQLRPADMGSWLTGTLVLYQTPLTDLFLLLKTRYGIEVVDRRKTRDNPAITSARFSHLPLEVLLKHLSFGWDFHFNQAKDTLYIK